MELPQKITNGTALWPRNFTFGNLCEETWNTNLKEYKHPYVYCSIIYNSQDLEAAVSISRWVDKRTLVHLHNEILLGCQKEVNVTLCDSMDRPGEHYSKWNKSVRERQIKYDFTHMKSNEQTELTRKTGSFR